jgi:hypothetical protein
VTETRIIRQVGAKATDPFCPWVNYDRMAAVKFWHGWQEGALLAAFSDDESEPRTFDMGSDKARIIRPAWMSPSGELDVLVLDRNRKTLRLVRFPPQPEGPARRNAAVAWSIDLPEESVAVRLGIGPGAEGGPRVAASVSQSGSKLSIRLIRVGEKSAEVGPPSLIDSAYALPESEPGIGIGPDGSVNVSVLFARHPGLRTLAVADVNAPRGGEVRTTISDVGLAQSAVVRAWTTYQVASPGSTERSWLIQTPSGSAFGGPQLVPVAAGAPIVDFLRMSSVAYVLALDSNRGPRLVATDF